ncbi:hypothetical protein AVEN_97562-1 [Araneus ventricosus]|uniref:Uncharacterized protein n=1 Tax=Araneus ventricosus TaxID=182803 RepID=A0A4Y2F4X1_ARAVE|nr:hypothetical protein AVEN_97562-1 [Araneus ventricosus]
MTGNTLPGLTSVVSNCIGRMDMCGYGGNLMNLWTLHVNRGLTDQSGGASVMVGGLCSWGEMGPLIRLETALTGDRHVTILYDHLYPFMSIVHSDGFGQFQQDDATSHTSRFATE